MNRLGDGEDSGSRLTAAQHARLLEAVEAHRQGDLTTAEHIYRELLESAPRCFDALHLRGALALQRGHLDAAIDWLRRAIAVDPRRANAQANLSKALLDAGDPAGAFDCAAAAVGLEPDYAEAWYNRGAALQGLARPEEAVASFEQAVALRPQYPKALDSLGNVLRELRRPGPALDALDRALALDPAACNAWNNRGLVLLELRRTAAALESFERALALAPAMPEALYNRGNALMDLQRFAPAEETFSQLLSLAPGFMDAEGRRLHARLQMGDWRDYAEAVERVAVRIRGGEPADMPFSWLCVSGAAELQLACARLYTRQQCPARAPTEARRFGHERIRIAYVGGDFGDHAVSHLLAGVFEAHDARQFETVAVSWGRQHEGAMRRRVEAAFARFIDVTEDDDAGVVARMRALEIDIAVDLCGHTRNSRTGIFALRAAPVQVNYLGFPATMGADYMDYLIADAEVVPENRRTGYAERVVWLPEVFQPNDDRRIVSPPPPRSAFGLPQSAVVLCSFNPCVKLNPPVFDVWMRVLGAVPASVLWLLATDPVVEVNLRREAERRGIAGARLIFAARIEHADYLGRYAHADLFLDSWPFNAGTTASDALSQGVPVLTWPGECFAARMSATLLSCLGLPELVAQSMADYEARAIRLARDPRELARLRRTLHERRAGHVLFDARRYTRHLEAALRSMWQRNENGLAPAEFAVPRHLA